MIFAVVLAIVLLAVSFSVADLLFFYRLTVVFCRRWLEMRAPLYFLFESDIRIRPRSLVLVMKCKPLSSTFSFKLLSMTKRHLTEDFISVNFTKHN